MSQAMTSFARRENLPAELDSEEWSTIPREIRERAFFMSKVTDAEILQRFREAVDDFVAQRKGVDLIYKELGAFLDARGYKAAPGKEGGLQDLRSLKRISLVMTTNQDMARGHASWVRKQTAIKAFPAQRLVRVEDRVEPRDWPARWKAAKEKLAGVAGVHPTEMVALLNHPIWAEISVFDQPYPPFDWGSGMGVRPVKFSEAKELGIIPPKGSPDRALMLPEYRSMNEGLEVTPELSDPVLKEALSEKLGRFGEWDGKKLIFTDPDGTRPYTAERLAEIWKKPAPPGYEMLEQRDALDAWDGGATADAAAERVKLRRLFDRIVTVEPPAEVHRTISLEPAQAVALVRGLEARRLNVPGSVAGWDFSARPVLPSSPAGWTVLITVRGGSAMKDVRALRPGKPGYVYVAGQEFKVLAFRQDVRSRSIQITLEEDKP